MQTVKFEDARKGVRTKWEGKIAFPDRNGPRPESGETWEVLSAHPSGSVFFLSLGKKIETAFHFSVSLPSGQEMHVLIEVQESWQTREDGLRVRCVLSLPEWLANLYPFSTVKSADALDQKNWHQTGVDTLYASKRGYRPYNLDLEEAGRKFVGIFSNFIEEKGEVLALFQLDFASLSWTQVK
jgi:hypothetical protein